jgi:hypothetical protein
MFVATDMVINEMYVPDNYSFYTYGKVLDQRVHIFIVDSWEDFPPERCQDENVRGCSIFGSNIENYIYLRPQQYIDEFGMTTFEHEVAHIVCQCDFHLTAKLREAIEYQDDALGFIIEFKDDIQKYVRSFI